MRKRKMEGERLARKLGASKMKDAFALYPCVSLVTHLNPAVHAAARDCLVMYESQQGTIQMAIVTMKEWQEGNFSGGDKNDLFADLDRGLAVDALDEFRRALLAVRPDDGQSMIDEETGLWREAFRSRRLHTLKSPEPEHSKPENVESYWAKVDLSYTDEDGERPDADFCFSIYAPNLARAIAWMNLLLTGESGRAALAGDKGLDSHSALAFIGGGALRR